MGAAALTAIVDDRNALASRANRANPKKAGVAYKMQSGNVVIFLIN